MVGGLIDQREAALPEEECCQQDLGLFAARESAEGLPEQVRGELQLRKFPQKLPLGCLWSNLLQDISGELFRVWNRTGEVSEGDENWIDPVYSYSPCSRRSRVVLPRPLRPVKPSFQSVSI